MEGLKEGEPDANVLFFFFMFSTELQETAREVDTKHDKREGGTFFVLKVT